jgi:hypothetical protein
LFFNLWSCYLKWFHLWYLILFEAKSDAFKFLRKHHSPFFTQIIEIAGFCLLKSQKSKIVSCFVQLSIY